MDEEYIHNEEAGSTADDFLIDDEVQTADMVCKSCGGHEVSVYKRQATDWDLTNQYECTACGATWED